MDIFRPLLDMLSNSGVLVLLASIIVAILLYLFPTLVAMARNKRNQLAIFFLNLFAGWTGIGWRIALIWASLHDKTHTAS